jgi:anti-sigma B factor antagonist
MSELARLDTAVRGSVLLAVLSGEVDISNASMLEQRIAAAAGDLRPLVVDLTEVTFLDSAGVRLLNHLVAAREPDQPVRVVAPKTGPVPFTLRLCGFRDDLLGTDVPTAITDVAGAQ